MKTQNWKELELPLSDSVLKTIEKLNFPYMTPVQVNYSNENYKVMKNFRFESFDKIIFIV